MAGERITELVLRGNNRSAIRALTQVADQSEKTARTVKRDSETTAGSFKKVGESAGRLHGVIGGLAGTVGLGGLVFGMKDAIKGGIALQAQQGQLAQALKSTGQYSADTATRLTDVAEKMSTHGGFETVTNLHGLTQLVTATGSVTKATKDAGLATDIARRTGKDYTLVVRALAMAEQGRTTGLGRLGIAIPKVTTAVDALRTAHIKTTPAILAQAKAQDAAATKQSVFATLQQKFAGSTAAFGHSAAGQMSNLRNAVSNMADTTGKALLPVITSLIHATTSVVGWLGKHKTVLYAILGVTASVAAILGAHAAITAVLEAKTYALRGANLLLGTSFGAAAAGEEAAAGATTLLGLAMDALPILAIIAGIVLIATHFRQFKAIVADAARGIVLGLTNMWHTIEAAGRIVFNALTWPFREAAKIIKGIWHGITSLPGTLSHFASSALSTVSFGLLHGGGVVTPKAKYFAAGGPVGTDTIPGWLSPGEAVLTSRTVNAIGNPGVAALNNGQLMQQIADIHRLVLMDQTIIVNHQSTLDARTLAESVTRYSRNKAARGPSSLVGGGLMTGGRTG